MTDYVLKIMHYGAVVPGATHYQGRVEGPRPRSCHGDTHYNAPWARGKLTCDERHEIPGRVEWNVDADWTEDRFARYAASSFEGDGPAQFKSAAAVIEVAVKRFKGEVRQAEWLNPHVSGQPGDRLHLGYIARTPEEEDEEWGRLNGTPPYGSVLAEIKGGTEAIHE